MAHQFPTQQQVHPAQMPPQYQNVGQQRQGPMTQQQIPGMSQQRGIQIPQPPQNPYANYDPQLALFTFERQKGAEGWEDVEAEQQHVNVQDLQNDVKRFQRNKGSVKRVLDEIPSTNARRLINELVEEQNQELMNMNRTLQWTIASVNIDWKAISRSKRQLKRISVILQTGPSGYEDPQAIRAQAAMAQKPQPMHPSQPFAHQSINMAQDMPQLLRATQQPAQQMRMPQHHAQPQHGQGPPPPPPPPGMTNLPPPPPPGMNNLPPPPPGVQHLPPPPPGVHGVPPPPPPPGAAHGPQRPPPHGVQQPRAMPGAFPESMHRPPMRPGQPEIEILNPQHLKSQKKSKGHHDESSSDEMDSDEWESETGDSGSDRFRVRHVEHGEFAHIGKPKRGRSRQSSRSKKSRHNRSHSKAGSRSRSHVRTEYRRRRDSDYIEPPPMGKNSPMSSKSNSPRSSRQQIPPIHIHVNNPTNQKPTRANDRVRRDSHIPSSPDYRKEKFAAEPMSRGNSWDRHSGTASFNDSSSVHTADDSVFSEPERSGHRSRHHSDIDEQTPKLRSRNLPPRQESFGHPHPSHIYGDVDPRARRSAHPAPNDYPHDPRQREHYHVEHATIPRPGVHRRNSVQTPHSNPFDTVRYPPRLPRSNTYAPDAHEPMYPRRELQYSSNRPLQESLHLDELAEAIERIKEDRRKPLGGYVRRGNEWDDRYERGAGGYDAYDHPRY